MREQRFEKSGQNRVYTREVRRLSGDESIKTFGSPRRRALNRPRRFSLVFFLFGGSGMGEVRKRGTTMRLFAGSIGGERFCRGIRCSAAKIT